MEAIPEPAVRALIETALQRLYALDRSLLVYAADDEPRSRWQVRSNERSVAARLAIHAHPSVGPLLGDDHVVDVEYSRVLDGDEMKRMPSERTPGQIFPDLIFHRRTERHGNRLVVEIKLGRSARPLTRPPAANRADLDKVRYLTASPQDMSPYAWGLCLDLRPDAASLHWVRDGEPFPVEAWTP